MKDSCDVLIVGGGIVGAASAFFLARAGKSVTLLEQGLIGGQASGVNFGNVRRQGRFLAQLPLANRARAIWGQLGELIGDNCEFVECGHLRIAFTDDDAAVLEHYATQARDWGLQLELLNEEALHKRFPYLGPAAVAGSFSPQDGQANPRLVAAAFARAAVRQGARIHENSNATTVAYDLGEFQVTTETGQQFCAPALVNAAGAWGSKISAQFEEPVVIVAQGPQVALTAPIPFFLREVLGTTDTSVYARQIAEGNVMLSGGPHGPASLDTRRAECTPDTATEIFGAAVKLVPRLREAQIIRCWSGVEGFTADGLPIFGESETTPGLFHAFAFCGHGFQLGPGVAAVLADLITTGYCDTPISSFGIERFKTRGIAQRTNGQEAGA